MPSKWPRSGATLSAMPWVVTHLLTRTPMAAILLSPPGRPGCSHPDADPAVAASRRSTLNAASVSMIQPSSPCDEAAHVAAARPEVEHERRPPAGRGRDRCTRRRARPRRPGSAGIEQVGRHRRGAGGVERRMFDQPDRLARPRRAAIAAARSFIACERHRIVDGPSATIHSTGRAVGAPQLVGADAG